MPSQKLREYLNENKINYTSIAHPVAYGTREISHLCHIAEHQLAKTVMINVGNKVAMVVLPARYDVDFDILKKSLHENNVTLANESDFNDLFADCELGAMPPFGNLYNIDVFVEKSLGNNHDIVFNAGTHTEVIKLAYKDFINLVHPKIIKAH